MSINTWTYSSTAVAAAVKSGPGILHTVTLAAAGDAATAIFYDNTAGSGTVICKLSAVANGTAHARLDVAFSTGCYVALTGTTPQATAAFA